MIGLGIVLLVVAETGQLRPGRRAVGGLRAGQRRRRAGHRAAGRPVRPAPGAAARGAAARRRAGRLRRCWRRRGAPTWAQVVAVVVAALFGAVDRVAGAGPVGLRARADDPRLGTAYALESVLDELIFVLGPLIVTLLATLVAPQVGLLAAAVAAAGRHRACWSATGPASRRPSAHDDGPPVGAAQPRASPLLMLVMVFVGGVFGAVEISAVAFADEAGHRGLAGPLLACYAGGSMLVGAGLRRGPLAGRRRAGRCCIGAAAMTATVAGAAVRRRHRGCSPCLLVLAGSGIAPTLICGFSLVERVVPAARGHRGPDLGDHRADRRLLGLDLAGRPAGRLGRGAVGVLGRDRCPARWPWWSAGSATGGCRR